MVVTTHPGIAFALSGHDVELLALKPETKEDAMAWGMIASAISLFGMLALVLYGNRIEDSIVVDQGDLGTESAAAPQQSQAPQSQPPADVKRAA